MNALTTLERRALQSISTPDGHMLIVAADQRNGMKAAIKDAPNGSDAISREELAEVKADLVRHLANHAPAILLDPEVALPQIVDDGVLSRDTALVVGLDASGAETVDGLKYTRYVPGTTPHSIREQGADVAKMLWYTRPDKQDADSRVAHEIRDLVKACDEEGLLLIVELLTYQLEDESDEEYRAKFADLVVDGAALAVACGAKILKLQYPGSAEASARVTEAAQGVPWAVLSAGVDHETFIEQVRTAVANGASGPWPGGRCGRTASRSTPTAARSCSRVAPSRACASSPTPSTVAEVTPPARRRLRHPVVSDSPRAGSPRVHAGDGCRRAGRAGGSLRDAGRAASARAIGDGTASVRRAAARNEYWARRIGLHVEAPTRPHPGGAS